jgi:hypothetical protein
MKSFAVAIIAIVSLLTINATAVPSQAASQRHAPPSRAGAGAAKEVFAVVKIGDDVKIVKKSEVAGLKKSTADEDKRDQKAYQDAKKEAAKSKDKSAMPKKPAKRSVQVLKSSLKTEQEAATWMEKYLASKKDGPKSGKTASAW